MAYIANITYELKHTEVMGYKIPFKRFDGIDYNFFTFIPDNIEEHLHNLKELEVRADDTLICTYPRSGTNWTNEIVRMLMTGSADYHDTVEQYFDMMPKDILDGMQSPRYYHSHFPFRFLPRMFQKKGRIIYVFRNPKDVAVSFHNFLRRVNWAEYDGEFKDFLTMFYNGDLPGGSWFDHVVAWEHVINDEAAHALLPIYYEDMRKDLRSHVDKIAAFLGIPYNEKLFSKITTQCEFDNLYKEKTTNVPDLVANLSKDKGNYLYRKGQVGGWKDWFTVQQNEEFDRIFNERMKNSKLKFDFE